MSADASSGGDGDEKGGRESRPSVEPEETTATRASSAPKRVTLQFAGPPLALPLPDESVAAETSSAEASAERLELELQDTIPPPRDVPAGDAWGRLRDGAPTRPRSVTPPTTARVDALELVSKRSRPPSTPALDLGGEMADRYALGDYSGALRVAELLLGRNPSDLAAQRCAESSRERLMQLYSARVASICGTAAGAIGAQVPRVAVPEHEVRWLGLDHRQGFLMSRLDGSATIDDLVDLSGMSRLDVLRTLVELLEARAIRFG
ncbi:MAG: hypothetical protein M3Y87_06925 [Myxococcota bacterium]|nr:hypothetical protein [Myxococcota bacterium]